jgi:TrmH family RNA methyltransferase
MMNMGILRLKLVDPQFSVDSQCRKMALGAVSLVEGAEVFTTLEAALKDEHISVGTSSIRGRRQRTQLYTPRDLAPTLWKYLRDHRVCFVFGSERDGLSEEQLALCQYVVSVPTNPEFPTLNLAQAVMIMAYETRCCQEKDPAEKMALAPSAQREQMFDHVEEVLIEIGFLSRSNPGHIMRSIRRFLGAADLTDRDVQILRGIMSQMKWYVEEGRFLDSERVKKP